MYYVLNRYIRKVIISSIMIVFTVLLSLSSIIRLIDELRKMGKYGYPFYEFIVCLILNIPKDFELFLPIATFLGGLLGLGIIEIHNEFVVMQVSGISKLQIAVSVVKASISILLCSIITSEWVLPSSERMLCVYKSYMRSGTTDITEKNKLGNLLWFIDNNCFFCVDRILTYNELLGLTLYHFDEHKKLMKIIFVKRALYINKVWNFIDIDELDFSVEQCVSKKYIPCITWNFVLTPYILSILIQNPNVLSISNLYDCIQYLDQVGQNSKYYQLIFWNKVLFPFSGLVMMIMALSCTFGPFYRKKISIRLFCGVLIGFVFYILNQICGTLSIVYVIPAFFGSILPVIIFLTISIVVAWKYY